VANVVNISTPRNVMSDEEFDRGYAELLRIYGDSGKEAPIRREQELARYFYSSGWTQEHLAERIGGSPAHVGKRVRFGQFLDFCSADQKSFLPTKTITEFGFRTLWQQTDAKGNDRQRFQAVLDLLAAKATLAASPKANPATDLAKDIATSSFADGKWHPVERLAETYGETKAIADAALDKVGKNKSYKCKLETKPVGNSYKFRLFRQHEAVSVTELVEKLRPLVKDLLEEGKKGPARISGMTVTVLANRLGKFLDEWCE